MDLQAVVADAERLSGETAERANAALDRDDPKEAKRLLTAATQELRELKRQVVAAEKEMRADFTESRDSVNRKGQVVGLVSGSRTRGHMARGRAMAKRSMAKEQQAQTEAYRGVKTFLDSLVASANENKRAIDDAYAADSSTAAAPSPSPPPPPPPATPAQWAADPHGRHELRYFDGTQWTEHVSDGGVASVDPAT